MSEFLRSLFPGLQRTAVKLRVAVPPEGREVALSYRWSNSVSRVGQRKGGSEKDRMKEIGKVIGKGTGLDITN